MDSKSASRLVGLFEAAERAISEKITRALAQTGDKKKLTIRELEQQRKAVKKILRQLLSKTKKSSEAVVDEAFNGGLAVARKELKAAGLTDIVLEMSGINARAMKIYSEQVYNRLAQVVQNSANTTSDIYQALKLDSSLGGAVGGYDAIGNVRRNMQKVSASQGITAFIDKSGRSWNMATYCEMLTRTSTMQVFHQAKVNEYLAHGEDLVIVTYHTPTCKKCAPWGGKILSLTGETKGYPTMEEAKASGLFHPNCRHTYSLWIEFDDETNNRPEQIPAEAFTCAENGAKIKKQPFSGVPSQAYIDILQSRYDNADGTARSLYDKYVPVGGAVSNYEWEDGAYYSPLKNTINLNLVGDLNNERGKGTTWYHEHGHYIDKAAGLPSHRQDYIDALKKDVKDYEIAVKKQTKLKIEDVRHNIGLELYNIGDITHSIQDIFGGAIKKRYNNFNYGHRAGYWQEKGDKGVGLEAFAHMTEALFAPEKQKYFEKYLPTAWAKYLDIVKELL